MPKRLMNSQPSSRALISRRVSIVRMVWRSWARAFWERRYWHSTRRLRTFFQLRMPSQTAKIIMNNATVPPIPISTWAKTGGGDWFQTLAAKSQAFAISRRPTPRREVVLQSNLGREPQAAIFSYDRDAAGIRPGRCRFCRRRVVSRWDVGQRDFVRHGLPVWLGPEEAHRAAAAA